MSTMQKTIELEDVKINVKLKLSALWIALMLLYIYADIFHLFMPGQIAKMTEGFMGPFPVTQGALLSAAILMMIPAVMIFLSLSLKPQLSRWANIIFGVLYTLVNLSNMIGETWVYYLFLCAVEIVLTILIIGYAWKWRNPEMRPE